MTSPNPEKVALQPRLPRRDLVTEAERVTSLFVNSPTGMALFGAHGRILTANRSFCLTMGHSPDELATTSLLELVHPAERDLLLARLEDDEGLRSATTFEARFCHRDGTIAWVNVVLVEWPKAGDPRPRYIIYTQDVTERYQAEQGLRRTEDRLRAIIDTANDAFVCVDLDGRVTDWNRQAETTFGWTKEEAVGGKLIELISATGSREADQALMDGFLRDGLSGSSTERMERTVVHRDGHTLPVEITAWLVRTGDDVLLSIFLRDITQHKEAMEQLAHLALHDPLTGLPNRTLLVDRVKQSLVRCRRSRSSVAVLFLDIDRFKVVNDSLGHDAGDEVLVSVAGRLKEVLRGTDTAARLGGDEFVLVCEEIAAESDAVTIAQRVATAMSGPFRAKDTEVFLTASVGIVVADGLAEVSPDDLLRDADAAMYRAKEKGRARFEVFNDTLRAQAMRRLQIESDLRRAIEREEFRVVYHPIVSLGNGRIVGVEALVRWQHPELGLIPPGEFLEVSEETGLIVPIGGWVLEEACRQTALWHRTLPQVPPLNVAVNLSARQLGPTRFSQQVAEVLHKVGLDPSQLSFEITESVLMDASSSTVTDLGELKQIGVHLGIDDFGTGYSSLTYLKRFPVNFVKVDRSFVDGLGSDAEDTVIVRAVVSLAHALGLTAVAEGVETAEQLAHLRELGCDYGQGYYFSLPLGGDDLSDLLSSQPRW